MHFLYIIYSSSADRFYIGETNDFQKRLIEHNLHRYHKAFTKSASDWKLMLVKECEDRKKAIYLERFIKKMKNRKFIQKVIDHPEILEEIWTKK